MVAEHKIERALEVGSSQVQPPPDLLKRILYEADGLAPGKESAPIPLSPHRRLGRMLEVAVASLLLLGLLGLAVARNLQTDTSPASSDPVAELDTGTGLHDGSIPEGNLTSMNLGFAVPLPIPNGGSMRVNTRPDGSPGTVVVTYPVKERSAGLSIMVGQAGCCLDAAADAWGHEVTIRDGTTGHYLPSHSAAGVSVLWWQEAGSYVALSGLDFTKEDLLRIADSMIRR